MTNGYIRLPGVLTEEECAKLEQVFDAFMEGKVQVPGKDFCDMSQKVREGRDAYLSPLSHYTSLKYTLKCRQCNDPSMIHAFNAISPILVPSGTFDIPVTFPTLPSLHVLHRPAPTVAPFSFSTSPVPTSVRRSLRSLALGQRHAAPRVLSVVTRGQRAGGSSTFHRPTAFGRRHGLRLRSIPDETAKQVKAPSLI